jgi:hypothetical protein
VTKPLPFTESRVRRVIAAVRKEGLPVSAVTVHPDGTITVHHSDAAVAPQAPLPQHAGSSEWEDIEA